MILNKNGGTKMKKLTAIIGICMIGVFAQAQVAENATKPATERQCKGKNLDPQEMLAKINEAIAKRTAELKEATAKGHTDIANAIKVLITDLTAMKNAIGNKDKDAFKTANEQRKKDREAFEALRKADKHEKKGESAKPKGSSESL